MGSEDMNITVNALLSNIEKTRLEMILLAHQFGYSNPHVVQCSQKLDLLLNDYSKKINMN
ncbi:aspartyl-phosphate phosphatase Spo0E family protein [Bacillus salipaludis]|uniref:Aspartyl-phosphate phosphatase Spo0E family protein n=2 Tax=Bacillus salipaludis TaxID=2547811 RepID=A0AA90R1E5_9BACI|nr:aspartyl-phosphate phosphatase Spo0E family protein [Bacillus salipaludis]MDQ6600174.1 aspartyl-phosphate phosphatase Spo0E family protein [Bacillus salipaludis]